MTIKMHSRKMHTHRPHDTRPLPHATLTPHPLTATACAGVRTCPPYLLMPWKEARHPCTEVWSACLYEFRGVSCRKSAGDVRALGARAGSRE